MGLVDHRHRSLADFAQALEKGGNWDQAVKKYQAVVTTNSASAEAETARKRLKEAYRE